MFHLYFHQIIRKWHNHVYLKKHPDSGQIQVLTLDKQLTLPYDILAKWHPPFVRIPYNAVEPRIVYQTMSYPSLTSMNRCLNRLLNYALMLEHGSHNLLPFSSTGHKIYPGTFLNRIEHENWKVYIQDSLANNINISKETLTVFQQLLKFTTSTLNDLSLGVLTPFVD